MQKQRAKSRKERTRSRLREFILTGGLVIGSLVFSLLFFELIVRAFFAEQVLPRFVIDSGYGVRDNQPSVVTTHFFPDQYEVTITTNSAGMRGPHEYSVEKPKNVFRVAMLGDSFLFGHGVNDDEVVSAQLERIMESASSPVKLEALNFGLSGFGPAEELVTFWAKVRPYKPDLVLLFYFQNDIGNTVVSNLFEMDNDGSAKVTGRSYLPGVKIREVLYSFRVIRWLFEHSQAWNLVRNRLSSIVHHRQLAVHDLKNSSEEKPDAVILTRAVLIKLVDEVRESGANIGFFVIPSKKMESNFPLKYRELESNDVLIIDGRDMLAPQDYYEVDGHWKASGHRKAAEAIGEKLKHIVSN